MQCPSLASAGSPLAAASGTSKTLRIMKPPCSRFTARMICAASLNQKKVLWVKRSLYAMCHLKRWQSTAALRHLRSPARPGNSVAELLRTSVGMHDAHAQAQMRDCFKKLKLNPAIHLTEHDFDELCDAGLHSPAQLCSTRSRAVRSLINIPLFQHIVDRGFPCISGNILHCCVDVGRVLGPYLTSQDLTMRRDWFLHQQRAVVDLATSAFFDQF